MRRNHQTRTARDHGIAKRHGAVRAAACCLLPFALAGCIELDKPLIQKVQERADALEVELQECNRKLAERDARVDVLERRLEQQPLRKDINLDDLFTVHSIQLASRSGGTDLDGKPGDDAIVAYVQPLDGAGDVLKAAGEVTVQLLDLTAVGNPKTLNTCVFDDPEVLKKSWFGGFLTNHYRFVCELPVGKGSVPREVHIRVTFLDWLTGKEFTVSHTAELELITP